MAKDTIPRWLAWAQQIQAVAQTGLTFAENEYETERYTHLMRLAAEIVREHAGLPEEAVLDDLFPAERAAPIVSVLDGHPHTLAFLGGIHRVPQASLGVSDFGQSGDLQDLYRHFGIDTDTIVGAAYDVLQG